VRKADNLPPSCAVVTKSGSLNFLEPSGLVQVCNGTALTFSFTFLHQNNCGESNGNVGPTGAAVKFRWFDVR